MRIAFYYYDKNLTSLDYSFPARGNPGVGGIQFCFLLLMYHLRLAEPTWQLTVYHYSDSKFPVGLDCKKIVDFEQCLQYSEQAGQDFLVMAQYTDRKIWKAIEGTKQRIIMWGHNFYYYDLCRGITNTPQISANVYVGKQQYDCYTDDNIIQKTTCIFNMMSDPLGDCVRHNDSRTVVYMGALIPAKGFLLLARMWKSILKEVPDARLKVLGSGNIYNSGKVMGSLGIADEEFEHAFLPYLTGDDGKLLKSVEFLGLVNREKYNIFLNASVGVVNPSAKTETFGMGIVEMATAKLPCVTFSANGHIDTIMNGQTGYLCKSQQEIQNKIVYLLKHSEQNERLGNGAKQYIKRFSPEIIVPQWIHLFKQLQNDNLPLRYLGVSRPYFNKFKWLIVMNRFLRITCRLSFLPSLIKWVYITQKAKRILQK